MVNGKIYEAAVKVLYAKGITSAIEEIDGKLYFVNTFEIKGYTADEVVPVTEGGALLKRISLTRALKALLLSKQIYRNMSVTILRRAIAINPNKERLMA